MVAKFYTDILTENGKEIKRFILEINNHRIILSDPTVQLFDSDKKYKDTKDIIHFYHDFVIEENKAYLKDNDSNTPAPDWQVHSSVDVYENSMTKHLGKRLGEILDYDLKENSRREYFLELDGTESTTDFECREIFEMYGFCEEDNFVIHKYFRHFDYSYDEYTDTDGVKECEFYRVFFGCGETQLRYNISGIYAYLLREDMLVVKQWADGFMAYVEEMIRRDQELRPGQWSVLV